MKHTPLTTSPAHPARRRPAGHLRRAGTRQGARDTEGVHELLLLHPPPPGDDLVAHERQMGGRTSEADHA